MASTAMDIDTPQPLSATADDNKPPFSSDTQTHTSATAVRSIEGWIIIVTNVHEEASEEDLSELFGDFGEIKNLHMNLDRRTGYVKGYVLIEYSTLDQARKAIDEAHETKLLDQTICVDFAFVRPPPKDGKGGKGGRGTGVKGARGRSKSPEAEAKEDGIE